MFISRDGVPELLLVLLPAVAIVWIVLRLVDLELRKLQPAWERWLVGALALVGGLWLVGVLACWFLSRMSEGTWFCPVCGALEERLTYFGFTVERWPPDRSRGSEQARRYARWFSATVPLAHAHGWTPVGCHGSFSRVTCSLTVDASVFHVAVPLVPDADVARGLVLRLASADLVQRQAMLADLQRSEDGPLLRLASGDAISREVFDQEHTVWLTEHPHWR